MYGLEGDDLWLAATGLGGGIGRSQDVCGALTGGVMALGLAVGRGQGSTRETRQQARDEIYPRARKLYERFREELGTVQCLPLIGIDLSAPDGQAQFKQSGARDSVCRPAVHLAIRTVVELV
jgi:C_GCAxxG_C_C family probable redox protein